MQKLNHIFTNFNNMKNWKHVLIHQLKMIKENIMILTNNFVHFIKSKVLFSDNL